MIRTERNKKLQLALKIFLLIATVIIVLLALLGQFIFPKNEKMQVAKVANEEKQAMVDSNGYIEIIQADGNIVRGCRRTATVVYRDNGYAMNATPVRVRWNVDKLELETSTTPISDNKDEVAFSEEVMQNSYNYEQARYVFSGSNDYVFRYMDPENKISSQNGIQGIGKYILVHKADVEESSVRFDFTYFEVTKSDSVAPTLTAYIGDYDGNPHTIEVSGGSGGTIEFSTENTTDDSKWSTTLPTRTGVGTTTVYAKIYGDENHNDSSVVSAKITINKATATAPTLTAYTGTYDGKSHTVTSSGGSGGTVKYSTDQSTWTTTLPTRTNAGTTTVYAKTFGDSNHNDSTVVSANITINKASATPPTLTSYMGTYDGNPHTITASGGSGGTFQYSTDNSNWSTTLPTRTDAGATSVYVKVIGDSNHDDSSYYYENVIVIYKADSTAPTLTAYTGIYDGREHTVEVSGGSGGTVKYSTDQSNWTTTLPTRTEVGTTTVYAKVFGDSNHNDSNIVNANITIKSVSTLTVNPNGGTWVGSTSPQSFTQDSGTTKTIPDPTTSPNGNRITYNANGGTLSSTGTVIQSTTFSGWTGATLNGTIYTFGDNNVTITANYEGNSVTLPSASKERATFLGWYNGTTRVGGSGDSYTPEYTTPNNEITLTAQYQDIEYTLTINPNGGAYNGSTSNSTVQGTYNSTTTVSNPTAPTGYVVTLDNEGITSTVTQTYTFDGWTPSTNISGITYTFPAKNETITANYTANAVTLETPTKTGYDFDGWYTEETEGTKVTSPYMPTEDITLYARWTAKTFTLTYDVNGGDELSTSSKTITYDEPYGELPTPTRTEYNFDGWYNENEKIEETDIVKVTEDTTLVAHWVGAQYVITFNYAGGSGDETSRYVPNGRPYGTLPEVTPPTGYEFLNWVDSNGNVVDENTILNTTTDVTLTAQYKKARYWVRFVNDDETTVLSQQKVEYMSNADPYQEATPEATVIVPGYKATFVGWDDISKLNNIQEDTVLTAVYEYSPIVYTIEYRNTKGMDNSNNPTSYTINDSNMPLEGLENTNENEFLGWFTKGGNEGEEVTSIDTSKLENIIVYAHWTNDNLYFKSEKYKVTENNVDNYENRVIYLDKIEPDTTVAKLIDNCDTNGTITVIDKEGNVLGEDDLVGTGMTIKASRYDEGYTMTTIVMGDLNGDGKVTATDLSALNQVILGVVTIETPAFMAADLDDNKKLTATDISTINQTILGVIKLTYEKPQN